MKPISEKRAKSLKAQWEQRLRGEIMILYLPLHQTRSKTKIITELREFKDQHGHCNVGVKGANGELGKFVMNQRYYYKTRAEQKNSLTPERIKDLENVRSCLIFPSTFNSFYRHIFTFYLFRLALCGH